VKIVGVWSDIKNYVRALLRHWISLVSGIGSVIVSAISASLRVSLPYWTFWTLALACFFIASFRAWRDMYAELKAIRCELDRLRIPKYSGERLQLAREEYAKLNNTDKALLRELRLRGQMTEGQADKFHESLGFGDQYRINLDMEAALDKILEDESGK
jgi:hypothetical protein